MTLAALRTAVQRRMVADVPVGVLLSGGLDSSLIVALLAGEGQQGLATFSIGFADAGGQRGNEFYYSDLVAAEFGTAHERIEVDPARLLPAIGCCDRRHERADGLPRLRRVSPPQRGGRPPRQGRAVRSGR